MSAIGKMLL